MPQYKSIPNQFPPKAPKGDKSGAISKSIAIAR